MRDLCGLRKAVVEGDSRGGLLVAADLHTMAGMVSPTIRRPTPADAEAMARVHVASWRETYRGLMSDDVLDDPDLFRRRVEMWTEVLGEPASDSLRVAVSEVGGEIMGVALARVAADADDASGPDDGTMSPAAAGPRECSLLVLYVLERFHGTGAGELLLDAVTRADELTALDVADPNPRAQAFYAKHGFDVDGRAEHGDITALRMVRVPRS